MSYILVVWTIVSMSGGSTYNLYKERDWRPIGEFSSLERCKDAGSQVNKDASNFRCLQK